MSMVNQGKDERVLKSNLHFITTITTTITVTTTVVIIIKFGYQMQPMNPNHYCYLIIPNYYYFQKDFERHYVQMVIHSKYQVNQLYLFHQQFLTMQLNVVSCYLLFISRKIQLGLRVSYYLVQEVISHYLIHCYFFSSLLLLISCFSFSHLHYHSHSHRLTSLSSFLIFSCLLLCYFYCFFLSSYAFSFNCYHCHHLNQSHPFFFQNASKHILT